MRRRDGFLDNHVRARLEAVRDQLDVRVRWRQDVNDLRPQIVEQLLMIRQRMGCAKAVGRKPRHRR